MMIDLHSHTTLSDGDLIPAELVRRAQVKGIEALALTDHVDTATAEWVVPLLVRAAEDLNKVLDDITVIPGAEVTHVPPTLIAELIERCRALGAGIVLVHGETIVEPVAPGTDRAGIEGGADVIAHPGLISDADAALAAKEGVALEISARVGHSLTNGHVAKVARKNGAKLVFGSDAHEPEDIPTPEFAVKVLRAAGLDADALSE
ncbi:MAG: histidinol phosphate phosphatase domain-containing protein, partial [Phycisphaerae bacterium]|nr:histidinol phosphate phosphatase domain-containing protein [Phycisphaerae bacterium]